MAVRPEFGMQHILDVAAAAVQPRDQIVGRRQRAEAAIDAAPDLRLVLQHLMQHGVDGRRLVLEPVLQFLDQELAVFLFLDQAFRIFTLLCHDRPVMLDAPDGEAANRPEHQQQRKPRGIGNGTTEIEGSAERASRDCRRDPDPGAANGGGQEHGREIGREEYVRTDLGNPPPGDCRQDETAAREGRAEKQRGLGNSLPAAPEFVDQFLHRSCHFT